MKDSIRQGWVRLHRQIENNGLWFLEPFTKAQAWIDLFLNANHTEGIISIRGNIVKIKRGQIGWSELTMTSRWDWSKNKVRRFLKMLETEQQIKQEKSFMTTIISIINYDKFQTNDTADDTADDTAERQQKDSRRYTNKNDNNEKNTLPSQAPEEVFVFDTELQKLKDSTRKDHKIIALYWKTKGFIFENRKQFNASLRRELRAAGSLTGYTGMQVAQAIEYSRKNYKTWTLETVGKRIADLVNINHDGE